MANNSNGKRFAVYVVREDEGERKSFWNKCGVAFQNKDGSFNIKLDLLGAVNLQLREVVDREDRHSGENDYDTRREGRGNDNRDRDDRRGNERSRGR